VSEDNLGVVEAVLSFRVSAGVRGAQVEAYE